ncbi:MAG: hypothetical protein EBZ83_05385, partial [Verrucomicrobia bacterium]|nr:hypothetical protein [Verrucomicrobiota bacterium]
MVAAGVGQFVDHLVVAEVTATVLHDPGGYGSGGQCGHALEGEGRIPHLGGSEALAGGVVGVLPEIERQFGPAFFHPVRLAFEVVGEGVVAGVDGGLADIIGLFVLIKDVLVSEFERLVADPGRHEGFEPPDQRHEQPDGEG